MSEINLTTAKKSPRIENEVLKWYYKNTFTYNIHLRLVDDTTGAEIDLGPEDKIRFIFYTEGSSCVVHTFEVSGENLSDKLIVLNFNDEISAKFKPGRYQYCATLYTQSGRIKSLLINCKAEVERCH